MDAADRPSDYVPSDDEDADRDEVSDEDDGSEDSKPKKKKSKAPATTAVKKDRTYINENNYCLQFRWNLFDQMAAVCQDGAVQGGQSDFNANKHKCAIGKTTKGKCAVEGCTGQPAYGCSACDLRLCIPFCLDDHIHRKGRMKNKTHLSTNKWPKRT